MADTGDLPVFMKKRRILFGGKTTERQRCSVGLSFMQAGRYDDALEFFARCDANDHVREIAEVARRECDIPVFLRSKVILEEKPTIAELEELGNKALDEGHPSMAVLAYEKAGLEEKAEAIRSEVFGLEAEPEDDDADDESV